MSFDRRADYLLLKDLVLIVVSITIAVVLVRTEVLAQLLASIQGLELLGSFIAGLFFTSIFTTAPAIAALGELALVFPLMQVAALGALGAVVGDLILFRFVRDKFSEHLVELLGHRTLMKRIHALFRLRLFRWLSFFVGGLIIASPLPDELAVSLLGFSKIRTSLFISLSYAFNFLGIILIGLAARAV